MWRFATTYQNSGSTSPNADATRDYSLQVLQSVGLKYIDKDRPPKIWCLYDSKHGFSGETLYPFLDEFMKLHPPAFVNTKNVELLADIEGPVPIPFCQCTVNGELKLETMTTTEFASRYETYINQLTDDESEDFYEGCCACWPTCDLPSSEGGNLASVEEETSSDEDSSWLTDSDSEASYSLDEDFLCSLSSGKLGDYYVWKTLESGHWTVFVDENEQAVKRRIRELENPCFVEEIEELEDSEDALIEDEITNKAEKMTSLDTVNKITNPVSKSNELFSASRIGVKEVEFSDDSDCIPSYGPWLSMPGREGYMDEPDSASELYCLEGAQILS